VGFVLFQSSSYFLINTVLHSFIYSFLCSSDTATVIMIFIMSYTRILGGRLIGSDVASAHTTTGVCDLVNHSEQFI